MQNFSRGMHVAMLPAYSVFSISNLVTVPSGWNADRQVYRYMIFCDEADFAFDEVNRTCN
jgi:hypothetical protein